MCICLCFTGFFFVLLGFLRYFLLAGCVCQAMLLQFATGLLVVVVHVFLAFDVHIDCYFLLHE